jgi:hypothetical protein
LQPGTVQGTATSQRKLVNMKKFKIHFSETYLGTHIFHALILVYACPNVEWSYCTSKFFFHI